MNQDQFMMDYYRPSDTVTVSAVELQQMLKEKAELEAQLRKATARTTNLETSNRMLRSQLDSYKSNFVVKLDVKI